MSLDLLQEKVRKMKTPIVVDLSVLDGAIPDAVMQEDVLAAKVTYIRQLLAALKGIVPAVRFDLSAFVLHGPQGLLALSELLAEAKREEFYVILNGPQIDSPAAAQMAAQTIFADEIYACDGLVISPYIGSDGIKPFVSATKENKALFVTVRSANRSAVELQDLLTGSRHVWGAAAETVARLGEQSIGKCGYSGVCAVASATASDSLQMLRLKHNRLFLLVDGLDLPGGNAKSASFAFDRFGHGAVVCVGSSVTAAWRDCEDGDYIAAALQAVERVKKNILRYVTIL